MRRLFVALTSAMSVVAFTHMASAADLYEPVYKAAPPPPAPGWTAWYVGVNAGASFGNAKTDFNGTPFFQGTTQVISGFGFSNTESPDGFMGGGQIGYNWQFSPIWVAGLEADFQGALERETDNLSQSFSFVNGPETNSNGTVATNYTTQIDWFGTARVRIGYVWGNGQVMSYLTGGLAYGEVKINGTNNVSGTVNNGGGGFLLSATQTFGHSQVNTGWVVGYGTEGRLGISHWSWKIEGLWMDLGTLDTTTVTSGVSCTPVCAGLTGGQVATHTRFTDGILRGGLNYHF
jgi:outer membrane immunogenic protein